MTEADYSTLKFNPIEEIELFLLGTDWSSERINENEIVIGIKGNYCEYNTTVHWNPQQDILHFAFSFNVGLSKEPLSPNKERAFFLHFSCKIIARIIKGILNNTFKNSICSYLNIMESFLNKLFAK